MPVAEAFRPRFSTAARNCLMSAPALKAGASEPMTSARKSRVARASAASSAASTAGFSVFILLPISKQATPSPRSHRSRLLPFLDRPAGPPKRRQRQHARRLGDPAPGAVGQEAKRRAILDREEAPGGGGPLQIGRNRLAPGGEACRRASRRRAGRSARTGPPTSRSRCAWRSSTASGPSAISGATSAT